MNRDKTNDGRMQNTRVIRGAGIPVLIAALIEYLENQPLLYACLTFLSAVAIRILVEISIDGARPPLLPVVFVHYSASFFLIITGIICIIHILSRESADRVARVALSCSIVIACVPVMDYVHSLFSGAAPTFTYIFSDDTESLWKDYLLLGGDQAGISTGMRIEILLVLFFSGLYIYLKTRSLIRAAAGFVGVYTFIFAVGILPSAVQWLANVTSLPEYTPQELFVLFHALLILPLLLFLVWRLRPSLFTALSRDLRFNRILHYELMPFLGFFFALPHSHVRMTLTGLMEFGCLLVAIFFAGLFSLITNNLADIGTDRISNPGRPSVTGVIERTAYRRIAWISLAAALLYASAAGSVIFLFVSVFMAGYFLYSMPPLRLKRVPFFSKGLIAMNSIVLMLAGFSLAGFDPRTFPSHLGWFLFIAMTACINFIDIKDYEGDRAEGIRTLPVLLGVRISKWLFGIFFVVSYTLAPGYFGIPEVTPWAVLFGVLLFAAMVAPGYNEKRVFAVYLTSLLILITYMAMLAGG